MITWVGRSIASPSFFEKSPLEPGNTAASWPAQEATRGKPRVRGRSAAIADEGGIARGSLTEREGEHGQVLGLSNLGSGQHPRDRGSFSDPSTFSLTPSHLELACAERPIFLLPVLAIRAVSVRLSPLIVSRSVVSRGEAERPWCTIRPCTLQRCSLTTWF